MAENPYDYENRAGIRPISWRDFHGLCKGLAVAVSRFQPEIILPIGRAGYYPGTLLAHMLQIELYPVRLSRRVEDVVTYQSPQWFVEPPKAVKGRRVLIVDEICSTGETIALVKSKVEAMGALAVKSAVLYAHTKGVSVPDYIGLITDELLLNPWDREILKDGAFQFHPEYAEALAQQGLKANAELLIDTSEVEIAKGHRAQVLPAAKVAEREVDMSQKIAIVTDSASYMPQEVLGDLDIPVIPQTLIWDGKVYRDGVDIDAATFYSRLRMSKTFPTTSQPTVPEFVKFFERVAAEQQTDTIVAVLVSSKMSGTVVSARAAKEQLPKLNIHVVDTGLISMGMGFPIIAGARAAAEGKPLDEVIATIKDIRDRIHFLGVVDTLEYLHRGGRIGGAKRLLGTALNLKPLLHFENRQLEPLAQVRTRRKALARMLDIAEERLEEKKIAEAAVADVDCPDEGDAVADLVRTRFGISEICRCTFSPVVGAHAGPGTTAFIFYAED